MSLAKRLRDLRSREKVSLQFVANAVGASKPHIWQLEKGETKNPRLELFKRLAYFYDVSLDFLAGLDEEK